MERRETAGRGSLGAILEAWTTRPGGPERRLRRYGALLLRLLAYGVAALALASAVLGLTLALLGADTFRSAPLALGLLVVSLGAGFWFARPAWRKLIGEHRFRCFYCEGETARARRHDDFASDAQARHRVRYTFECERCGRTDGEL